MRDWLTMHTLGIFLLFNINKKLAAGLVDTESRTVVHDMIHTRVE